MPTDIRIVGVDQESTCRADPAGSLFDVHFALSVVTPAGWPMIATAALARRGVAGRRAWALDQAIVVCCAIDEVENVLIALSPVLAALNREYQVWQADRERARLAEQEFEFGEREKLRKLVAGLVFA
jgi:hypothetical protein